MDDMGGCKIRFFKKWILVCKRVDNELYPMDSNDYVYLLFVKIFIDSIMITRVITLKPDKWIIFLPILLFSLFYAGFGRSAESVFVETEGLE